MTVTIYHNPRCSKSRQTLALLQERGIEPDVIEYLQNPPDAGTLTAILKQLDGNMGELVRVGESEYKEASKQLKNMNEQQTIDWLTQHPKVIQRPIVVTDKGARIGRPPENVLEILGD